MKVVTGLALVGGLGVLAVGLAGPCWSSLLAWDMAADTCPDGSPRLQVSVESYGLERGRTGNVYVSVEGVYVTEGRARPRSSPFGAFDADLSLVVGDEAIPLECENPWDDARGRLECQVELPEDVPDGDHVLRVQVDTPLEDPVVELDLPLFRPSIVHVLTDRPLYEPGDTLQFRALVLRAGTLEPIDDRPGHWFVVDPAGRTVLQERTDGGPWGISASDFPLAEGAPQGSWTVRYVTGSDQAEVQVAVEPFTLPNMTAQVQADDPWYRPGDELVLRGTVEYASGAPVQDARIELSASGQGWPPPRDWDAHELRTDSDGAFVWRLGEIPQDVVDATVVTFRGVVTDSDGDVAGMSTSVTISPEEIVADAVTEVRGGMVPDLNNRVYLRLTTPDGRALGDEEVFLKNRWDSRDEGRTVTTDADGVAALQLDPGQPVSITLPLQPVRPEPIETTRALAFDSLSVPYEGRTPSLLELTDAQAMVEDLSARCEHLVVGSGQVGVVAMTRSGRVAEVTEGDQLNRCLGQAMLGRKLGDKTGIFSVNFKKQSPKRARLTARESVMGGADPELQAALDEAEAEANRCMSGSTEDGGAPFLALFKSDPSGTTWIFQQRESGDLSPWAERACIERVFGAVDVETEETLLGRVWFVADAPGAEKASRRQPTVINGFEFDVSIDGVGAGTWRSTPGTPPAVRLRADRVLVDPGDTVTFEILRGPDFAGELPDELELSDADGFVMRCPRTAKALKAEPYDDYYDDTCPPPSDENSVAFVLQDEGFHRVSWSGADTVVYSRPAASLTLELSTDQASYAPGDEATLDIQASGPAVVSLVGVDERLGQLAPLPTAGELNDLQVGATSSEPAWGVLDALALTSGQVRGENAAMAAVLRVDGLTGQTIETPWASHSALVQPPIRAEMQSVFWEILGDLGTAVRAWEAAAETDALLTNADVARMFDEVLDARAAAGEPLLDPFGRRPTLGALPDDLVELCDPRLLVRDATHLPEDVQPWTTFVKELR